MMPVVGIVRAQREFGLQHGQVAPVLVFLRPVIADMLQTEIDLGDAHAARFSETIDIRGDLLMDDALEADLRIVEEQAVFPVEGESRFRPQQQPSADKIVGRQQAPTSSRLTGRRRSSASI